MRKRNIKTVAHWVIMSILLLFPILMVGVSSFANDEQTVTVTETYEYETNEVNSNDDLIEGNIYKIHLPPYTFFEEKTYRFTQLYYFSSMKNYYFDSSYYSDYGYISQSNGSITLYIGQGNTFDLGSVFTDTNYFYIVYYDNFYNTTYNTFDIVQSDYLGQVTTDVDIQNASYKQEVNNWCNGFKNLPVNQWYSQLLNVIGVGQTTNSVMNVIYVYPLYVLWVYLIDLIVDCLLVIIHFGHNALSRLGGDND